MDAQLSLLSGGDTALADDGRVALSIRESLRARHLILQVLPPRTVEVVVPKGMRPDSVQSFVRDHSEWIRRAGRELIDNYPEPEFRPARIAFPAIDRQVPVKYQPTDRGKAYFRDDAVTLTLHCAEGHAGDAAALLRRWLLKQGSRHLKPWLLREAQTIGLIPGSVHMRLQKTRWGSCSSSGVISLNAALLLVAPELVRYLFIHELCHLKYMTHGKRYWQTVARYEPDFRRLDRRLSDCWRQMPTWLPHAGAGAC
jgi:predicted metal-dependent hydrolase